MKSRTAHVWHVALLSALLVISLASFSVTAAFMQYLRDYGFLVSVPYYNRPGVYRTARIRGIYLHANGIMVAAGVLTFLTALYLLLANTFSMYKQRRVATSVELELFFIGMWWILSLVGNGIYSTNLDWNNCDSSKLCILAIVTLALGWAMTAITTALVVLLIYHGSTGTRIDKETPWGESTLSHSSRIKERLMNRRGSEVTVVGVDSEGRRDKVPV